MEVFHYYPWLFPVLAFIFSLLIGSFLNVVIHRLPIMMEREWQQECSEYFSQYKIPAPEGSSISVSLVRLARNVKLN